MSSQFASLRGAYDSTWRTDQPENASQTLLSPTPPPNSWVIPSIGYGTHLLDLRRSLAKDHRPANSDGQRIAFSLTNTRLVSLVTSTVQAHISRHSSKKDPSGLETPIITTVTSCLPQGLSRKIEEKIQQGQGNQQEWVGGVLICVSIAILVLSLNIALTVIAVILAYSKNKGQDLTSATLHSGSCSTTKDWVRALHLVINVLSTIMLAASNYCMQCLFSPSRQNVDSAHAQRMWLDIGVPSMKNLHFVDRRRSMLWMVLLISSLPIHLVYNSAVFPALGTNEYSVLLETADFNFKNSSTFDPVFESCFEKQVPGNTSDIYSEDSEFEYLDKKECIDTYTAEFIAGQGILILVTNILDWLRK